MIRHCLRVSIFLRHPDFLQLSLHAIITFSFITFLLTYFSIFFDISDADTLLLSDYIFIFIPFAFIFSSYFHFHYFDAVSFPLRQPPIFHFFFAITFHFHAFHFRCLLQLSFRRFRFALLRALRCFFSEFRISPASHSSFISYDFIS